jgi:F0F1-type ATP synthase membrane subunit b/b'
MSNTATIARDLREAEMMRRMQRDTYQKYHRNLAEARKRAEEFKKWRR